ncbi:4-hydroxy-2-oxovalerate aldolase [Agrobacterium tumefaciens str. Kerr 14]|uniref:4-hydroxy-2-oxovalerate aldolase n=1 Tax=Agrobacterium tumefaciens str. Kerr 14 TaxID=1183424 RepID=A0A1S7SA65_AGRTU|nr:aldolase/citrate lyase family protein [Agrobacterium tumefaciens]CUX65360.1 4-hydroxy-2-oxovalerate aldolase [Agrobacterium tumefaciens str. Kerr 14]
MNTTSSDFRTRLGAGDTLLGTWIKTPDRIVVEVLSGTPMDALCLDAEHAPFDRSVLDASVFAARSAGMPVLVRPPSSSPEHILNALDIGATGVVAPHICTGEDADNLARHCIFGPGGRGYAGSTRAAGYTRTRMADYRASATAATTIIAQLEDREALDNLDEIVSVDRIDCLFIGRIDLTVSLGAAGPSAPEVMEAMYEICAKARQMGRRLGMFVADISEIPQWIECGVSLFLLSSDQSFLQAGASALRDRFNETLANGKTQERTFP